MSLYLGNTQIYGVATGDAAVGGGSQETPSIEVNSAGLITATAGNTSITKQLSSSDDSDFVAGNIKQGVNIFGLDGSFTGETQQTPTISVDSSGLITATAGDKSTTQQLPTQAAKTIVPSKNAQTAVSSGKYTTGEITVAAITPSTFYTTVTAPSDNYNNTMEIPGIGNYDNFMMYHNYTGTSADTSQSRIKFLHYTKNQSYATYATYSGWYNQRIQVTRSGDTVTLSGNAMFHADAVYNIIAWNN